jgi:hypothetical protein
MSANIVRSLILQQRLPMDDQHLRVIGGAQVLSLGASGSPGRWQRWRKNVEAFAEAWRSETYSTWPVLAGGKSFTRGRAACCGGGKSSVLTKHILRSQLEIS